MDYWDRYRRYLFRDESLGVSVDVSRMNFPPDFFGKMERPMAAAFADMHALEEGAIANPDEGRMVGHYWLRAPGLAPKKDRIEEVILDMRRQVREFADDVAEGRRTPERGGTFRNLLLIGVGGSALGPQFMADCLRSPRPRMRPHFLDNTDPDGMDCVLDEIGAELCETLTLVISKSGGTEETRQGMLEVSAAYERAGLTFGRHAVAVTQAGSELDEIAVEGNWLARFPMWDWVGGRTSICSAVGLLPAALMGFDTEGFLAGARDMDVATRSRDIRRNPAALLAMMWYMAGSGRGEKDMVVLPYKDRLALCSRYLQQLVMESLGKEIDLQGKPVYQGMVVYGNKGSTDQHAYVQQLREGLKDFFVTFIQVLRDREEIMLEVERDVTSGDYLSAFLLGTRRALAENQRESITISFDHLNAASLGKLVALFERTVGLYASLIGINAYNQPGVQAGKDSADLVIGMQRKVLAQLKEERRERTAEEIAALLASPDEIEVVYHILMHLAANPERGVVRCAGRTPSDDRFKLIRSA